MNKLTSVILLCLFKLSYGWLLEGDVCKVPGRNKTGKCINISQCEFAKLQLKKKERPPICGFIETTPLVCCLPIEEGSGPGVLSRKMCNKYFDVAYEVHFIDLGTNAQAKEFPHMAAVGYGSSKTDIVWLCGATLISHYFVLTAAHCAYSNEFGNATWVRLGDLDLKNTTDDANPIDQKITSIFVYPQYKPSSHYHDIALFKLENRTFFQLYFNPACLQVERELPVNVLGATGWGKNGIFGEPVSHLQKVDLNLVNFAICSSRYSDVSKRRLEVGIIDNLQVCAGDEEGKDTCPGDSGGPLHYFVNRSEKLRKHFVVAGITSFGKGCGGPDSLGVYTRVSAYIEWIEGIVWPEPDS